MDFAAFSDASFDSKQWVNAALKDRREGDASADAHASGIVMKLQMFIQEVNNSLEATSLQVVQDMPRVVRNVEMVHQEVQSLKERITSLADEIAKIENTTATSMSLLMRFDEVKSRMEATAGALQEADNWETLSNDVDQGFATADLGAVSTALLGLKRSLMVLTTVPDYADRQRRLAQLEDRLEAALSPRLLEAFAQHDTATAKECVRTFGDMNREQNVQSYYYRCHTAAAGRTWQQMCQSNADTLPVTLKAYYTEIAQLSEDELVWGAEVFGGEVVGTVSDLVAQILQGRTPSIESVLADDMGSGADQLKQLIASFNETVTFSEMLRGGGMDLEAELLAPFATYQNRFKNLLTLELQHALPTFAVIDSVTEWVAQIKASFPAVFASLHNAIDSCVSFTGGAAMVGLVACINAHLTEYAKRLQAAIPHLSGITSQMVEASLEASEDDNWTPSQSLLQLIETCGQIFTQIDVFQGKLVARFNELQRDVAAGKGAEAGGPNRCAALYLGAAAGGWETELVMRIAEAGPTPLGPSYTGFRQFNLLLHKLTIDTVLAPLTHRLGTLDVLPEWADTGTDDFSLSPMPYITKIGEQLLTLPQQLEPFTAIEDSSDVGTDCLLVCLTQGKLPKELALAAGGSADIESSADHWLESVSLALAHVYIGQIKTIAKLSSKGGSQLCADIEYFANVLSALEVEPPAELELISSLLAVDNAEYQAAIAATPNAWVASVRKL